MSSPTLLPFHSRCLGRTLAAALLLGLCLPAADAATVGYWNFDEGTAPSPAISLHTTVNSPLLDGTAGGISGGSAPLFSNALPGAAILDGEGGAVLNASNDASLYFTNPGFPGSNVSNAASLVTVSDPGGPTSLLKLGSFTIEGFLRYEDFALFSAIFTKNRVDGPGSSWMLDTDGAGHLRARFDTQALGTSSATSPGFNQSFSTAATINDGQWHHVALTYNGANRAVDLFVDYVDVGGGTATNPLVYDDSPLRFGGSGGGRGFDGNLDEIRLSDTVLAPSQFLHVAVPEPSAALLGAAGLFALLGRRRAQRDR